MTITSRTASISEVKQWSNGFQIELAGSSDLVLVVPLMKTSERRENRVGVLQSDLYIFVNFIFL